MAIGHEPTASEMNNRGGCGGCGYSLLDLARHSDAAQCPECGHWNQRPAYLNPFPWPRPTVLMWRFGWPALVVATTLPLAALALPRGIIAPYLLVLAVLCTAVPVVAAIQVVRTRCEPERQGRMMGLLAAAGITANLAVLLVILKLVSTLL